MPEQEQDILSNALVTLQNELESFGKSRKALDEAKESLDDARRHWGDQAQAQHGTVDQLIGSTSKAIEIAERLASKTEDAVRSLLSLAKAIEDVNFPLRLDKMDLNISTQGAGLASLRRSTEDGLNEIRSDIADARRESNEASSATNRVLATARRREIAVILLLVLNLLLTVGLFAMRLLPGVGGSSH